MNDSAAVPSPDGDRRAVVMSRPAGQRVNGAAGRQAPRLLQTSRLRLSPVTGEQLEELFRLHSDPRAFADDSTAPLGDHAQMRWVLARWIEGWERHGLGYYSVRARTSGTTGSEHDSSAAPATPATPAPSVPSASSATPAPSAPSASSASSAPSAVAVRAPVDATQPSCSPDPSEPLPSGLLGVVGLSCLEWEGQELLSAYWRLDPAVLGRGVATEAMGAVLAAARCGSSDRGPRDREVVAVTAAHNRPSRSLAARLGFVPAPSQRPVPGGREGDVLLVRPAS